MNVLSLEAATGAALCALQIDGEGEATVRAIFVLEEARELSQHLIGAVESTLGHAGWALDDVDVLAVGLGPGSWTGLRIALSTWKTLAQTRDIALVGVPSYDAWAQAAWRKLHEEEHREENAEEDADADQSTLGASRLLLVSGACRPGEVYGKIFESHPEYLMAAQDEWIAAEQQMLDTLWTQALSRHIEAAPLLVGTPLLPPGLAQRMNQSGEASATMEVSIEEASVEVAIAGAIAMAEGEVSDPLILQPLYLAPSAAERNFLPSASL